MQKLLDMKYPPISYHIIIIDGVVKYPPAPGLVYSLHQIFAQGLKLGYLRPFRGIASQNITPTFFTQKWRLLYIKDISVSLRLHALRASVWQ
jgi:hypothetical protein